MKRLLHKALSVAKQNKQLVIGLTLGALFMTSVVVIVQAGRGSSDNANTTEKQSASQEASSVSPSPSPDNQQGTTSQSTGPTNSNSASNGAQGSAGSGGLSQSQQSAPAAKPKINNWSVVVYQTNITTCGFPGKPACAWPGGLILSLAAKNTDTGAYIPLKDCSMTASPIGFSIPGGSFSANPSVYSDAGVPVCGGGYDFPTGGQYKLRYEIWLADGLNVDMPYRGGEITDFSVQNQ